MTSPSPILASIIAEPGYRKPRAYAESAFDDNRVFYATLAGIVLFAVSLGYFHYVVLPKLLCF